MQVVLLTAINRFHITAGCGVLILILFLFWGVDLIKVLLTGQESRLQKEYGSEENRCHQKRRRVKIKRLVVGGFFIVGLIIVYLYVI